MEELQLKEREKNEEEDSENRKVGVNYNKAVETGGKS